MADKEINPPLDSAMLDARVMAALQTAPQFDVPVGFAARVAAQVPTHVPPLAAVTLTPRRYGYRAGVACLVVLFALIVIFAPRATGMSLYEVSLESIFCAQFALLAVWLVARDYTFLINQ